MYVRTYVVPYHTIPHFKTQWSQNSNPCKNKITGTVRYLVPYRTVYQLVPYRISAGLLANTSNNYVHTILTKPEGTIIKFR